MHFENIGFHVTKMEEYLALSKLSAIYCFQVGLQNPKTLKFPFYWAGKKAEEWGKLGHVVCHAPYNTNIISDSKLYRLSIASIRNHLKVCSENNIEFLVVHPGVYDLHTENSIHHSVLFLRQSLSEIFKGLSVKTILLLENLSIFNSLVLEDLEEAVKGFEGVGLCLDTNHAYGQGYEDKEILKWAKRKSVKILHLNGTFKGSIRGRFEDYHTQVSLQNSVGLSPEFLFSIAKEVPEKIKIVEQNFKYALKTCKYLQQEIEK